MAVMVPTRYLAVQDQTRLLVAAVRISLMVGRAQTYWSWMGQQVLRPKVVMARTRSSL